MSDQPPGTPASSTSKDAETAKLSATSAVKGLAEQMGNAQGDAGTTASGGASASLGTRPLHPEGSPAHQLPLIPSSSDLLDIRAELLAMMNKPGWKTSELWFLLAAAAAAQWAVHAHLVNGDLTELLTYAAGLVYTYFRLTHKADVMGQVAADFADHAPGAVTDIEAEVARVLPQLLNQEAAK